MHDGSSKCVMEGGVVMRMTRCCMWSDDQGEEEEGGDGVGDSGCDDDGDWPQGATASSSMMPRIRLYTASGKCLESYVNTPTFSKRADDVPFFQPFEEGDRAITVTVAQFGAEHGLPCRRLDEERDQ